MSVFQLALIFYCKSLFIGVKCGLAKPTLAFCLYFSKTSEKALFGRSTSIWNSTHEVFLRCFLEHRYGFQVTWQQQQKSSKLLIKRAMADRKGQIGFSSTNYISCRDQPNNSIIHIDCHKRSASRQTYDAFSETGHPIMPPPAVKLIQSPLFQQTLVEKS